MVKPLGETDEETREKMTKDDFRLVMNILNEHDDADENLFLQHFHMIVSSQEASVISTL